MARRAPYPVEADGLVSVLGAVVEDVPGRLQESQDEAGVPCDQAHVLGHLGPGSHKHRGGPQEGHKETIKGGGCVRVNLRRVSFFRSTAWLIFFKLRKVISLNSS
jgi:hypothetical protein